MSREIPMDNPGNTPAEEVEHSEPEGTDVIMYKIATILNNLDKRYSHLRSSLQSDMISFWDELDNEGRRLLNSRPDPNRDRDFLKQVTDFEVLLREFEDLRRKQDHTIQ